MLVFNHSGLLVPDTLIPATFQQLENEFVTNIPTDKRKTIFENYLKYTEDFKKASNVTLHQWVNGSFISKKKNPGDIDLVTFLDFELVKKLGKQLDTFKFPGSELNYGVDAYIVEVYPDDNENIFRYRADKAYWYDRFTKTRRIRGNRLSKGFLEVFV